MTVADLAARIRAAIDRVPGRKSVPTDELESILTTWEADSRDVKTVLA